MEKGYRDAMIIVGNKFEPGLGGGICQVSSTLYNASLLAGLSIVERHNHNLAVAYAPLGRDATVAYGIQDLKFRNNTEQPIYIRAVTSGGKLTINIYGNLQYKQKIDIYNIVDKTLDFTTVFEQDPTLTPGEEKVDHKGQLGYVVRSFRSFYGNDGKIVKTEQLATDTYKPLNQLILQGPEIAPEPGNNTEPPTDSERPPGNSNQNGSDETPLDKPIIRP
jgi:vancomycin resistance protein YoaR